MNVLVTGHCGYIGSVLVPMLVARGHQVSGLDADWYRRCTFTGALLEIPSVTMDIRDISAAELADVDAIIHLAGLSNDPLGDLDPALTDEINHLATARLGELARSAGVRRFVFASSCSIYGATTGEMIDESAPVNPVTPYGWSKVHAEYALSALASDDFSPVFIRAGTAYGLSARLRFDLVVNNLTAWAVASGQVMLKSDGSAWRPLVHVQDIARAYLQALEAPQALIHNRAFNVGSTQENYQVREVAEMVRAVVPGSAVSFQDRSNQDARCYRVNCDYLASTLPGARPRWQVRQGVESLYQAFMARGLSVAEFEGERFQRIAHIRALLQQGVLDSALRARTDWT
jgi:nucleoside-diphosphate-sugar epimerase